MAEFEVDGLTALIQALEQDGLYTDEVAGDILFEMADEMKDEVQTEMQKSPYDLSRISRKVGYTKKVKTNKDEVKYVTVSIKGTNERGERNAAVAFVLNYGRSEEYGAIQGSYFWTRASEHMKKRVLDIAEKKAEQYYKSKGLI